LVVDNNLFVHACQTQDDSSGASIFEMSFFEFGENDVVVAELAGINTGTEGFRALCRDSDGGPAKGYFYGYIENTGLRVPNVRPMVRSF
jgi:hypothetical protein